MKTNEVMKTNSIVVIQIIQCSFRNKQEPNWWPNPIPGQETLVCLLLYGSQHLL